MQVVTDVLMQGKFSESDSDYKAFPSRVRWSLVPNLAYPQMVHFHATVKSYHAAPKWAKILYQSPGKAAMIY